MHLDSLHRLIHLMDGVLNYFWLMRQTRQTTSFSANTANWRSKIVKWILMMEFGLNAQIVYNFVHFGWECNFDWSMTAPHALWHSRLWRSRNNYYKQNWLFISKLIHNWFFSSIRNIRKEKLQYLITRTNKMNERWIWTWLLAISIPCRCHIDDWVCNTHTHTKNHLRRYISNNMQSSSSQAQHQVMWSGVGCVFLQIT